MKLTYEECAQNHGKKCAGHSWFGAPVVLCAVQGRKTEREEFSSVSVSGEKNRWSTGEGSLRLAQYNLSLMEVVSLDSGPHIPSHTAPGSLRHRQGKAVLLPMHHTGRCLEQQACLKEAKLSLWFSSVPSTHSSPIATPVLFPCSSRESFLQFWSELQMGTAFSSFSSFSTQTVSVVTRSSM